MLWYLIWGFEVTRIQFCSSSGHVYVFQISVLISTCSAKFSHSAQDVLLKHIRLRHGGGINWPCFYDNCVCTFKNPSSLKSHLSKIHNTRRKRIENSTFLCDLCDFNEICTETQLFSHLGKHLRNKETLLCPFQRCGFKTNNLSTFSSHRTRKHKNYTIKDFRLVRRNQKKTWMTQLDSDLEEGPSSHDQEESIEQNTESVDAETLEHKLAHLFLSMQTVLHISKSVIQKNSGAVP